MRRSVFSFCAAVCAFVLTMAASTAHAQDHANLAGKTCTGSWQAMQFQADGKLVLRFADTTGATISGQVVSSERSSLPYPHDFGGVSLSELKTNHGVMNLSVVDGPNNEVVVTGTAHVNKDKRYSQREVDVKINLRCPAAETIAGQNPADLKSN